MHFVSRVVVCLHPFIWPPLLNIPPLRRPRLQLTMTILLAVLIMIDFMFLDDSHFIFDPSIQVRAGIVVLTSVSFFHQGFCPNFFTLLSFVLAELHASHGTTTINCRHLGGRLPMSLCYSSA